MTPAPTVRVPIEVPMTGIPARDGPAMLAATHSHTPIHPARRRARAAGTTGHWDLWAHLVCVSLMFPRGDGHRSRGRATELTRGWGTPLCGRNGTVRWRVLRATEPAPRRIAITIRAGKYRRS